MVSNAEKIRQYYKELLADGNRHSRTELFEYARNKSEERDFSLGMLTGGLKTLVDGSKEYACVDRATYQKISLKTGEKLQENDIVKKYREILENALERIENDVKVTPFQILGFTDEEKNKIVEVQKCVNIMKETLKKI